MGKKGPGKKLIMGESHSLRPNKDYVSHEALSWVNDQDNANETICRAVQFYYCYFNEAEEMAEGQPKGLIKKVQAKTTIEAVVNQNEQIETSDIVQNEEVLGALSNMINSVKR